MGIKRNACRNIGERTPSRRSEKITLRRILEKWKEVVWKGLI
jgi:hypothetical protein